MLMIRLSRVGKKNHPLYRVIVSEKSKDTKGDYLELLGTYDPHANTSELKADRIKYWIDNGAQPSGTVHNLLIDKEIISGEKLKVANIRKKKETEGNAEGDTKAVAPEKKTEATNIPPTTDSAEKKEEAPKEEKKEIEDKSAEKEESTDKK